MPACEYPVYTSLWFWLLAIGLLFFAIGVVIWDVRSQLANTWWVWALIIGGAALFIIGLIIAIYTWWRREAITKTMATLACQGSGPCSPVMEIPSRQEITRVATPRRLMTTTDLRSINEPVTVQTTQRRLVERDITQGR